MYADDTVPYTHRKSTIEVATKLARVKNKVGGWLHNSCLTLILTKLFLTKKCKLETYPEIVVNGQKIKSVREL